MKKTNIFLIAAMTGLCASSCSDFLEEENKTGETADLTYQTVSGIDGLVSSAYAYCRGWWGKEPSFGLAESGTDLWYTGFDCKQRSLARYDISEECLGFSSTSGTNAVNDNPCLDQYWEFFYAGIDVCNNVLKYVPECKVIEPSKRDAYLADAYFLRALYYSQMVAIWGPIPYNAEPITAINNAPVREPEAVIYKNILSDLELSMSLYEKAGVTKLAAATGPGRAYYYSAEALKARVALTAASWLGKSAVEGHSDLYAEAATAAGHVIEKSEASLYDRTSDTWSMKYEEYNKNSENLFATHYNNVLNSGYDNCVPYRFVDGGKGQYNSLLTRKGYGSNGGSANVLFFNPLWNNGCSDLGGSGVKDTQVFNRVTTVATGLIKSKATGMNVDVAKYYSPYGRGFARFTPSLYLWKILDDIKDTDQRYNATLLTHYNIPIELSKNAQKYPDMDKQEFKDYEKAYEEDGNYFNGGGYAIYFSILDGDSPEGKALAAEAKGKYRIHFAHGGEIPVFTSGDLAKATPTRDLKELGLELKDGKYYSPTYGDTRYNEAKIDGQRNFPSIKKFLDDQTDMNYLTFDISYRDIMVLRLAEMYLIKAEAELATGGDAKATLNELRHARAIPGKQVENEIKGTVDIETILKERAIELCGEYTRWFDLKRTHTLEAHLKAYNGESAANFDASKHYYRPIPKTQFDAITNGNGATKPSVSNGVIQYTAAAEDFWQNPGY